MYKRQDYDACLETISRQEAMQQEYSAGELSEEEWAAYQQELNDAYLHRNASKLFTETAQRFAEPVSYTHLKACYTASPAPITL